MRTFTCAIAAAAALAGWSGCGERDAPPADALEVPNVVGLPQSEAECALARAGLSVIASPDGSRRAGCHPSRTVQPDPTVIEQTPGPGEHVGRRTPIRLVNTCQQALTGACL